MGRGQVRNRRCAPQVTLRVRPEAKADMLEAARWYEQREVGVGIALVAEVEALFQRIEHGPARYRLAYGALRRALTRRFPYAVYFS